MEEAIKRLRSIGERGMALSDYREVSDSLELYRQDLELVLNGNYVSYSDKEMFFTIYDERVIYLNRPLMRKIGNPKYVVIEIDPVRKTLQFKPYTGDGKQKFTVHGNKNIISKEFIRELRRKYNNSHDRFYSYDNGVFQLDIKKNLEIEKALYTLKEQKWLKQSELFYGL